MRDNLSLKTGESVHGQGVGKLYNATSFKSIETHEFLTIVQHQPNYIKKLYSELVNTNKSNGKIIHDYINAEEAEINIQESTKGDKIKKLFVVKVFPSQ